MAAAAPLRLGMIGCGWIAEAVHMPALAAMPEARVVAVADSRDVRRAVAARRFPGARPHRDAAALLADPEVEAVVVSLPPAANREVATAALEAGRHLYLEKPLALRVEDGEAILAAAGRAAERTRTVAMIGFNFRRSPAVAAALAALARGDLGDLQLIQGQTSWRVDTAGTWRAAPSEGGGGALSDLLSHHIDLVHLLAGRSALAVTALAHGSPDAFATVSVQLELGGAVAQLHASHAPGRNANRLVLSGTAGEMTLDLLDPAPPAVTRGAPAFGRLGRLAEAARRFQPLRALAAPLGEPSFAVALGAFVAAAQGRVPAEPSLAAGLEVMRVVDAARRSAAARGARTPVERGG